MRRLALFSLFLGGALVASIAGASDLAAQEVAARFEITSATDTSFTFQLGRHTWIKPGQRGIVVDPMRRDVLIGRFRVSRVDGVSGTAVMTGQTTLIGTEHAALIDLPRPRWFAQPVFWIGAGIGAVIGAIAGAAL